MRKILIVGFVALSFAMPSSAVEFLGIDLCRGHMETSVVLPEGSPLSIVSVEVGKEGALVIQFEGDGRKVLSQVDDLMFEATGLRGVGDDTSLQWSGQSLTAFAMVLKRGFVGMAVNSSQPCGEAPPAAETPEETVVVVSEDAAEPAAEDVPRSEATAAADDTAEVAAPVVVAPGSEAALDVESVVVGDDFSVRGDITHTRAGDDWVDVMGVVRNGSGRGYRLATFDLSFFDAAGALICVDTISVSVLKDGQERAFRDSIQCPSYDVSQVARTELQFAGGY